MRNVIRLIYCANNLIYSVSVYLVQFLSGLFSK